LFVKKAY